MTNLLPCNEKKQNPSFPVNTIYIKISHKGESKDDKGSNSFYEKKFSQWSNCHNNESTTESRQQITLDKTI